MDYSNFSIDAVDDCRHLLRFRLPFAFVIRKNFGHIFESIYHIWKRVFVEGNLVDIPPLRMLQNPVRLYSVVECVGSVDGPCKVNGTS